MAKKKKQSTIGEFATTFPCGYDIRGLSKAKRKPRNCSDARWRMELKRRAMSKHSAHFGCCLPDPDRIH